jgi:hypothetical protein
MKPFLALVFPLVLLLSGCGPSGPSTSQTANAIAEIENLGGRVELRRQYGSDEVIGVSFYTKFTDAGLEHLKVLTNLEGLRLDRTQITDAGLEHLKGHDQCGAHRPHFSLT